MIIGKDFSTTDRFRNSKQMLIGICNSTKENVFIKLRQFDISDEAKLTSALSGAVGFPQFYYYGIENGQCALITSLLGKSLQDLFYESNLTFSLKTILMIADQMLERLNFLYNKGTIHGRISPEHILIDKSYSPNRPNLLYLINFEHATRFRANLEIVKIETTQSSLNVYYNESNQIGNDNGSHTNLNGFHFSDGNILLKKPLYDCSTNAEDFLPINSLLKEELTAKSDLESLIYVLAYIYNKGKLPWSHQIRTVDEKINVMVEDLFAGMPEEFILFAQKVKQLAPDEVPDYAEYRKLIRSIFVQNDIRYDNIFDWNSQKVIEFNFDNNVNTSSGSISIPLTVLRSEPSLPPVKYLPRNAKLYRQSSQNWFAGSVDSLFEANRKSIPIAPSSSKPRSYTPSSLRQVPVSPKHVERREPQHRSHSLRTSHPNLADFMEDTPLISLIKAKSNQSFDSKVDIPIAPTNPAHAAAAAAAAEVSLPRARHQRLHKKHNP